MMQWVVTLLSPFSSLHRKLDLIMAKEADLEAGLAAIAEGVTFLAGEIADLKNSPAPVTQEQLDALDVKAQAIKAAIEAAK